MRVAADHVRTISFSIADNQLPGNAKAGYVIRRILRRAVRYVYTFLDQKDPMLYKLVDTLIDEMGDAYPELPAQGDLIKRVIREEEESFLRTLDNGIKLLDSVVEKTRKGGENKVDGKDAFTLYDTYGFPLDLTELILREQGMEVDIEAFQAEMQKQKDRARNAASVENSDWIEVNPGNEEFVGYDESEVKTHILRYRKVKQKNKEYYQIMLAKTPFYGEMGGQVGDKGWLISPDGEKIDIFDTKKENNTAVHLTKELPSDVNSEFIAKIDIDTRAKISANHSATHLIHEALREVLGTHVEQKGSLVTPEGLRFDFSHFQKVTPEELRKVEHIVNERIRKATPLQECREMPIAEAREMGAMALFGEKYGDKVRVVKFGSSVELCGGTHVANTGNIGMIRIVSESSIASGIRRIEAVTGPAVEKFLDELQDLMNDLKGLFSNSGDLRATIQKTMEENSDLHKQVNKFMEDRTAALAKDLISNAKVINGVSVIILPGIRLAEVVKNVAFIIRKECPEQTVFIGLNVVNAKPLLTLALSDDLVKQGYNAGKIVREAAKAIKGGGGGQPFFAQAGGKDPEGLNKAGETILEELHLKIWIKIRDNEVRTNNPAEIITLGSFHTLLRGDVYFTGIISGLFSSIGLSERIRVLSVSVIQGLLAFVFPTLLTWILTSSEPALSIGLREQVSGRLWLWIISLYIIAYPALCQTVFGTNICHFRIQWEDWKQLGVNGKKPEPRQPMKYFQSAP